MMELKNEINEEFYGEEEDIFDEIEQSRKTWKLITKVIFCEALILSVLIVTMAGIHYWRNNPMRIAKEYVHGQVKGEWNEIYSLIHFGDEDNPLLSKKMFVTAQALVFDTANVLKVETKNVKEVKRIGEKWRTMQVTYDKNDEILTMEVPMVKVDGKWFVDGIPLYVKRGMKLEVPAGAKVSLDAMSLDNTYLKDSKNNRDSYVVPYVFGNLHYVALEKDGMQKSENLVEFQDREPSRLYMQFSQETLEKAGKQALAELTTAYKNAAAQSGRRTLVSLNLTENNVKVKQTDGLIEVTVQSNFDYHYKNKRYRTGRTRRERGTCASTFFYSYNSGTLTLQKENLNTTFL